MDESNAGRWAIACYGIAATSVDDLIERVTQDRAAPARWIVFSEDAPLLQALVTQWGAAAHVVIVLLPSREPHLLDAALSVLQCEQVALRRCVWVQSSAFPAPAPSGVATSIVWGDQSADQIAAQILPQIRPAMQAALR